MPFPWIIHSLPALHQSSPNRFPRGTAIHVLPSFAFGVCQHGQARLFCLHEKMPFRMLSPWVERLACRVNGPGSLVSKIKLGGPFDRGELGRQLLHLHLPDVGEPQPPVILKILNGRRTVRGGAPRVRDATLTVHVHLGQGSGDASHLCLCGCCFL